MLLSIWIFILIWLVKLFFPRYWKVSTKIIHAQARHETGNFKSKSSTEAKNLFGMKVPAKRKTMAKGEQYAHAKFSSYLTSIIDYFYRQSYFKISGASDNAYIENTVNGNSEGKFKYAEDPQYLAKWRAHIEQTPPYLRILAIIAFFVPLIILIVIIRKWLNIDLVAKAKALLKR